MSLRNEMLRAARLSPKQLGPSSLLVEEYLRSQLNPDGGFGDRSGSSDLYYTVFGLESLIALGVLVPPAITGYLLSFGHGQRLDLVHLCCLIRCRASAGIPFSEADREAFLLQLESYRTADGGYRQEPIASSGSAYGCFLTTMAYEDLGLQIPLKDTMVAYLRQLQTADGGFANEPSQSFALTPSTAAVATLLASFGKEYCHGVGAWLLSRYCPDGGFFATVTVPIPDLLSTATALHALGCLGVPLDSIRESCLDFIQSLWNGRGAFRGSWMDDTADCEYTYYALLALGHL